jgi:hypothetical protein
LVVHALWKLLPPAEGMGNGSGMGGAATAGRGGGGADTGATMVADLRAGSLLAAKRARTFSTSPAPARLERYAANLLCLLQRGVGGADPARHLAL